ncbi:hypothetical protein LB518_24325 [Mesorhizobium sp. BR1-1-16]|uniref:hypothetical protein n=1 Tax=Mesorhizobium sp. BR1-1-16 TaxID=2876653 RepID=UPI001CCBC9E0|nr:hypothetical protein [Mesorhizobium sp. BR1-1-16]MBZ9939435.1 hypothetical protein [Mesorhizobium sp. BR1-1-16]
MGMSDAERKRKSRERQRQALKVAPDQAAAYLRRTFARFLDEEDLNDPNSLYDLIGAELTGVGMQPPNFADEDEVDTLGERYVGDHGSTGSTAKAERAVHALRVSAQLLSVLINTYKIKEIDARLAEIERADLSDPATRKQALADVARLSELRRRLDKEVRHSFKEIAVKGE